MTARPLSALPPSSWPKNPHYVIDLDPLPCRLRALLAGETVADSRNAVVMFELGHTPVYYLPMADIAMDLAAPNDHSTHCPYKGDASYWDLTLGGRRIENAFWSYREPYGEMAALADLAGFYWDRMDAWYHDEQQVHAPLEIAGRVNAANSFAKCYPALAAEWDRDRNQRIQPYEFSAESPVAVWWKNAAGESWQEPIRARVLRAAAGSMSSSG